MIPSAPLYFPPVEPSFSVIVPFFNEGENVAAVCLELKLVLGSMSPGAEVILIDDGSTDGTAEVMDRLAISWPHCRVYHLAENQGQSAALLIGFIKATAPFIVTLDGDGQNDPRDIPRLLARLEQADMVVGIRTARQDSWARRKISRFANLIRARWLGDGVSDAGCALKAFRREVVGAFIPIRTLYSFMPALAVAAGFQVVEEPVNHRPRRHGQSRYSIRSFLLLPIIDFIGLQWFRSRRCQDSQGNPGPTPGSLSEELYQQVARRSIAFALCGTCGAALALLLLIPARRQIGGPEDRKIDISRAEQIALQEVPAGHLLAEELRMQDGRLTWTIDVQPSASEILHEIDIDAMDGHIIAMRDEQPAEEAFELAVENHRFFDSKFNSVKTSFHDKTRRP